MFTLRLALTLLIAALAAALIAPFVAPLIAWAGFHFPFPRIFDRVVMVTLAIAVIEEGFFRAFLLDGMAQDFGRRAGLAASSAVYAAAHLVRSPAHFEV